MPWSDFPKCIRAQTAKHNPATVNASPVPAASGECVHRSGIRRNKGIRQKTVKKDRLFAQRILQEWIDLKRIYEPARIFDHPIATKINRDF
jgi:hypothetical protein